MRLDARAQVISFGCIHSRGIELAHRIRKDQHLLPLKGEVRQPSLKQMWDSALNRASGPILANGNCDPAMHQISRRAKRERPDQFLKSDFPPVRYLRKISFGGNLNLFITPRGGRYWRYFYRYGGNEGHFVLASTRKSLLIVRAHGIVLRDSFSPRVWIRR